jgi:hypothetical protein
VDVVISSVEVGVSSVDDPQSSTIVELGCSVFLIGLNARLVFVFDGGFGSTGK